MRPTTARPRSSRHRGARALVVTALVALLLGGGSGFIAAADIGERFHVDSYATGFGTAAPMIGDRGIYTKEHVHRENGTDRSEGAESEFASFEWVEHVPVWDPTGTPRSVVGLRFLEPPVLEDYFYFDSRKVNATWLVDPEAHSAIAVRSEFDPQRLHQGQERADTETVVDFPHPGWPSSEPLFCGMFHTLQGTVQDLRDGVTLFPACRLDDWGGPPANTTFHPEGLASIGDVETLVLHAAPAPDSHAAKAKGQFSGLPGPFSWEWQPTRLDMRVWLAAENPYPLRIESYDPESGYVEIYRLVAFGRGDRPFPGTDDLPAPLPEVQQEAVQPWGPDDSGIDHPYPLSEAFRNARDDPTYPDLREFLEAHPDARVTEAQYRFGDTDGTRYWSWSFELWGDRNVLGVCTDRQSPRTPDPLLDPNGATIDHHSTCREDFAPRMEWANWPQSLPTIGSLVSVWQTSFGTDTAPNSYGFNTFCPIQGGLPVDPCIYRFTIGDEKKATGRQAPGPLAASAEGPPPHRLETDGDGRLLRYDNVIWPMDPVEDAPARSDDENHTLTTISADAPVWRLPESTPMVGTAVLATASGLLYWLWPTLKSGLFTSLFSRIRRDRLLDHPIRSELHATITSMPGAHIQELVRRTGHPQGTVRHHLDKLVDAGLLTVKKTDGFTCYFADPGANAQRAEQASVLKSAGARAVYAAVLQDPGASGAKLAAATGLTRQTVSYHLDRLTAAGVISRDGETKGAGHSVMDDEATASAS